ncbi:hypothetical protein [Nocardioides sp. L-11A]|uniref:hypothetical protein n=1 Tax=Nocardioides sp. L-11A TaxID=3043848 RepID=UPI002499BEC1|nr:hypothetical protein QJ852_18375 [Nocardioides sp. L-11A]
MEILFWLLPAAVLTLASMAWVAWWGREGRGEVDRETAARRLGEALTREQRSRPGYAAPEREPDRHTGVALRAPRSRPVVLPDREEEGAVVQEEPVTDDRRAS